MNKKLIRKMQTASGGPITRYETLPNIEVVGYRPIELKTYKPLHKDYPFTGHSSLDIPIDEDSAYTQGWYSPYGISVDKTSNSKDYNLVTNNCADATLGALNYIFGTKEKPLLFTTPGDVRDYAINKLHGKVTRDKDGIDTILIPRNKNNAKKISKKALEWAKNKDENTIYEFEYKQGGKMNILEFLKNGSGIHIKKKNRGKFTSYCGGKVTDECILKGKNSSNPAIRKRATFADNARHFKHKEGGFFLSLKVNKHLAFVPGATITDSNPRAYSQIKKHKGDTEWIDKSSKGLKVKSNLNPKYYLKRKVEKASKGTAFGLKVSNALGKVGNFLNSDTGKFAVNGITSMIGTAVLNRAIDKQIEANNKMKEVDIQKAKLDRYRKLLGLQDMTTEIDSSGNIINKSSIVALNNAYKQAMESTDTSEILDAYDRVNRLLGNEKYMNLKGMLGDMVDTLSSILGGKKKDNNSSNNSTSSNNSYFGNYVKTLFKNYGTLNSDGSMNLGNGLGTFSTTGGYKPQQYQIKTYTPLLKFSV